MFFSPPPAQWKQKRKNKTRIRLCYPVNNFICNLFSPFISLFLLLQKLCVEGFVGRIQIFLALLHSFFRIGNLVSLCLTLFNIRGVFSFCHRILCLNDRSAGFVVKTVTLPGRFGDSL